MLVPVEPYRSQQVSFCSSILTVWITALFQREKDLLKEKRLPIIVVVSVISHLVLLTNKHYLEAVLLMSLHCLREGEHLRVL